MAVNLLRSAIAEVVGDHRNMVEFLLNVFIVYALETELAKFIDFERELRPRLQRHQEALGRLNSLRPHLVELVRRLGQPHWIFEAGLPAGLPQSLVDRTPPRLVDLYKRASEAKPPKRTCPHSWTYVEIVGPRHPTSIRTIMQMPHVESSCEIMRNAYMDYYFIERDYWALLAHYRYLVREPLVHIKFEGHNTAAINQGLCNLIDILQIPSRDWLCIKITTGIITLAIRESLWNLWLDYQPLFDHVIYCEDLNHAMAIAVVEALGGEPEDVPQDEVHQFFPKLLSLFPTRSLSEEKFVDVILGFLMLNTPRCWHEPTLKLLIELWTDPGYYGVWLDPAIDLLREDNGKTIVTQLYRLALDGTITDNYVAAYICAALGLGIEKKVEAPRLYEGRETDNSLLDILHLVKPPRFLLPQTPGPGPAYLLPIFDGNTPSDEWLPGLAMVDENTETPFLNIDYYHCELCQENEVGSLLAL